MTHQHLFWSLILIGVLLMLSRMLKSRIPLFERLFLPSSIIAGVIALLIGPQVFGAFSVRWPDGLIPPETIAVWRGLPGLLISVVFAALFLGKPVPGPREIWLKAGPQVAFGQTLAWGQYVVGITLALLVLTPVFGMSPLAGALIEIGFEGGHGTAAGMAQTFRDLGFPEGADLALGLATIGIVSGVLLGTILINWAARRRIIDPAGDSRAAAVAPADGDSLEEFKELQWEKEQESRPTDPLSIHLGVVGLAIGIGWLIKEALLWIEQTTWGGEGGVTLIRYVPLFPLAMIGGVIVQVVVDKTRQGHHINRRIMNRISGAALDFTIVAALGTLSLSAIGQHLGPFLLLAGAGIAWNVACVLLLAPRIIPANWFERGIGDFGQSTGVTVTGILLMRMADPRNKSGALESFGYKQLLFEPIVGGGLFTAASMPLIAQFGPGFVLILTSVVTLFWIGFGWWVFGRKR
ncbi:MAG TPA: sodium/glutamate symporter [Kiritimatiellia bacterium]|nr:sodium/glutamate symporter [Kiritimatiellia bacterium]HMO99507.1 sodium/glutamate symporter [Kiritimatiellia bacterium]HMP91016.1 sodium/glutamate symporter [Kiritimatiellia bacterium]